MTMNCPEYGTCHDPEWCQQGGPCESAAQHCSGVGCHTLHGEMSGETLRLTWRRAECQDCEQVMTNDDFTDEPHEPWPPALLASVATSGLSLAIGAYGALTTWSLAPLRVTVVGFGVSFLLAASVIPWRGAWQEMRERRRIEAAFEAIIAEEAQR
jgi:hypothetical protein